MANKKRGRKQQYNYLTRNELFSMLSAKLNYIDEQLVQDTYYALVKLMVQEIKRNGAFRMPDFGDFYAMFYKERMIKDVNTGQMRPCPQKRVIKFETNDKLKKYLNQ